MDRASIVVRQEGQLGREPSLSFFALLVSAASRLAKKRAFPLDGHSKFHNGAFFTLQAGAESDSRLLPAPAVREESMV